jgi:hypothetical protein
VCPTDGNAIDANKTYGRSQPLYLGDTLNVVAADSPVAAGLESVIIVDTSAGNIVINLPSIALSIDKKTYYIEKSTNDTNTVTINPGGGDTIEGGGAVVLPTSGNHIVSGSPNIRSVAYGSDKIDNNWVTTRNGLCGDPVGPTVGSSNAYRIKSSTGPVLFAVRPKKIVANKPLEMKVLTASDIAPTRVDHAVLYMDETNGLTCVQENGASGPNTTNSTFQTKLSLTTPSLPSGNYRLGWTAAIKGSGEVRARVDDGTTTYTSSSAITPTDFNSFGGFKHFTALSGVHTFNIKYRAISGTATIKEARLEFWRTS